MPFPLLLAVLVPARLAVAGPALADTAGETVALRGIAFDNWLTERVPHGDSDVRAVKAMGANCIKLTVPFDVLDAGYPSLREDGLALIDGMVALCRTHELHVVLSCAEPCNARRFSADRGARLRFVSTWLELARRYAPDPTVAAIVPLEEPTGCLASEGMYGDLCSYLATELRAISPDLPIFLAPHGGGGPAQTRLISYPNVGALCRLPADADAPARDAVIEAARTWSTAMARPVLVDRLAVGRNDSPQSQLETLGACLAGLVSGERPLSFVYDRYRTAGPWDGVALSYSSEGRFVVEEGLRSVLAAAFAPARGAPEG